MNILELLIIGLIDSKFGPEFKKKASYQIIDKNLLTKVGRQGCER